MATMIKHSGTAIRTERLPPHLVALLPERLNEELRQRLDSRPIEELRLRCGRCASLTVDGRNLPLRTVLGRGEMDALVNRLCDGSLYAHRDAIAQGYLTLPQGIRVGICGRASVENHQIVGIYDISGLNFRIPSVVRLSATPILRLLQQGQGVLIYAPPGGGKTTLLRCVAARMAGGREPLRVAVIDTRGELGFSLEDGGLCLDVLTGYPRPLGIEIATRTMNAELIVCDEIGEAQEAEAILAAQNCGVPFVASAHADSVAGLLRRTGIRQLHRARVFGAYVGIRRPLGGGEFQYTVTDWEEADGILQAGGGVDPCD